MRSAIQPSAERYVIFFSSSVFALYERKNRTTDTMSRTMLPHAKSRSHAALPKSYHVHELRGCVSNMIIALGKALLLFLSLLVFAVAARKPTTVLPQAHASVKRHRVSPVIEE